MRLKDLRKVAIAGTFGALAGTAAIAQDCAEPPCEPPPGDDPIVITSPGGAGGDGGDGGAGGDGGDGGAANIGDTTANVGDTIATTGASKAKTGDNSFSYSQSYKHTEAANPVNLPANYVGLCQFGIGIGGSSTGGTGALTLTLPNNKCIKVERHMNAYISLTMAGKLHEAGIQLGAIAEIDEDLAIAVEQGIKNAIERDGACAKFAEKLNSAVFYAARDSALCDRSEYRGPNRTFKVTHTWTPDSRYQQQGTRRSQSQRRSGGDFFGGGRHERSESQSRDSFGLGAFAPQ